MSQSKFTKLLETTGYPVYFHYIPQGEYIPAISFIRVTPVSSRVLSGSKTQNYTVWRVTCVANSMAELEEVENAINLLDNTSNADYQRIFVLEPLDQINDSESTFFSTVIDIRTYDR